ncbi:MAG: hypothetical protein V2I67_12045 [Thermoanaerobaculales bacterium]|jgi:hypothetical protein|nr:hypothetical protein [Thermoanaerobaculales bacterium]
MIVSAWYDGHSTYGVRVLGRDLSLWFRPEWEKVSLLLPDLPEPVEVPLTESFWHGSPELRSPRIKEFFLRHGLEDWPRQKPPRFELEALGGGVFRLNWLKKVEGQRALPLGV